jgi:hypothetical protein
MRNKFVIPYGILAFIIVAGSIAWFALSVSRESRSGSLEAERSFQWLYRETVAASISDGFMTDSFIAKVEGLCRSSQLLSAFVITTPAGGVFAWPEGSPCIAYNANGTPSVTAASRFMKVYSQSADIGDNAAGSVVLTAVVDVLAPEAIFNASRNTFMILLAVMLLTLVVLVADRSKNAATPKPVRRAEPQRADKASAVSNERQTDPVKHDETWGMVSDEPNPMTEPPSAATTITASTEPEEDTASPEGLFSPDTGIGWEPYLAERLDAELVRAASSEQDLALIIIRVSGLQHSDPIARRIAQTLLETFKFKDMVFEYASNGYAGILQNVNLDQAMKTADNLYTGIDAILMDTGYEGQITIGITTRTARLLPASRMIEEAVNAAQKAVEEPNLPIVAFRANPEKYRNFVAEQN